LFSEFKDSMKAEFSSLAFGSGIFH
jgi:hypothetical protein